MKTLLEIENFIEASNINHWSSVLQPLEENGRVAYDNWTVHEDEPNIAIRVKREKGSYKEPWLFHDNKLAPNYKVVTQIYLNGVPVYGAMGACLKGLIGVIFIPVPLEHKDTTAVNYKYYWEPLDAKIFDIASSGLALPNEYQPADGVLSIPVEPWEASRQRARTFTARMVSQSPQ